MSVFTKKKQDTFNMPVPVYCADESLGELPAVFRRIGQSELETLLDEGDLALLNRVVVSVGEIPVEGDDGEVVETLKGDAAKQEALNDVCCVSALVASYLEAVKTSTFRKSGSRKRR